MFISIVILSVSTGLFLYWFRYSCLLILSTRTTKDYAAQVAKANQLGFQRIQEHLQMDAGQESLGALRETLERDYRLLTGLLSHAADAQVAGVSLEQRMLMVDYRLMQGWYKVANQFSQAGYARRALAEMADIVAHFANEMGERSAVAVRS